MALSSSKTRLSEKNKAVSSNGIVILFLFTIPPAVIQWVCPTILIQIYEFAGGKYIFHMHDSSEFRIIHLVNDVF